MFDKTSESRWYSTIDSAELSCNYARLKLLDIFLIGASLHPRSINGSSKLSGKPNARGSLVMDWHPIQGVVVMLMVPLCKRNLDKLWLGIGYLAQLQTSNLLCQPNTVFSDLNLKILWIYRTNYFKEGAGENNQTE